MNSNPTGIENTAAKSVAQGEVQGKKSGAELTKSIIKWSLLGIIIILAAAMVTASVMFTRLVSVEEGQWLIDLTGQESIGEEQLQRIAERFPDAQIRRNVDLGGVKVLNDVTRLTLTDQQGVTAERLIEAAPELPYVNQLNLTGLSVSIEQYERLRQSYPGAKIEWIVPAPQLGGLTTDTRKVSLMNMEQLREIEAALAYLPLLSEISMTNAELNDSEMAEVKTMADQLHSKGIELTWGIKAAGANYPYNTTDVRLSGSEYGAEHIAQLSRLPYLTSLTLDGIGTSDLTAVTSITTLESITICNMDVDDIMVLADMYWLGAVYVKNTNVSQAELNRLQDRIPECITMRLG